MQDRVYFTNEINKTINQTSQIVTGTLGIFDRINKNNSVSYDDSLELEHSFYDISVKSQYAQILLLKQRKNIDPKSVNNYTSNIAYLCWTYFRNLSEQLKQTGKLQSIDFNKINNIQNITQQWDLIFKKKISGNNLEMQNNTDISFLTLVDLSSYAEKNYLDLENKKLIYK